MSRAALLPTPGDPFLLSLWFKFWPRWSSEVDRLYVYLNTPSDMETIDYIEKLVKRNDKTFFILRQNMIEHGDALEQMVKLATEDTLMMVEDDAFIFDPKLVRESFELIERGVIDAVGSPRGSCSKWLYDTAAQKFGVDVTGYGDRGPNFWPNFFFAKRSDLLKVSNFGAKFWDTGRKVDEIGEVAPEPQASDTFAQGSLQLRALGLNFGYVPQYHGSTDDQDDWNRGQNIWDGLCPWLHVGSLSSGFHGMLKPGYQPVPGQFATHDEKLELERRLVFWKWGLEEAQKTPGLGHAKAQYKQSIQNIITGYDLNESRIDKRLVMYKGVMRCQD